MKKLFFFRSSAPNSGNSNAVPQPATDKQVYWENPSETGMNSDKVENSYRNPKGLFSKAQKHTSESQSSGPSALRRSRSFSSPAFHGGGLEPRNWSCLSDQSRSPSSNTSVQPHSSRRRTPERQSKGKQFEAEVMRNAHGLERPGSAGSSRAGNDFSESSSFCSSNVSGKVLDRFIDGEQQQEMSRLKNSYSQKNHAGNGNGGGRRPPRVQYTAPTSPTDSMKENPRSCLFGETVGTRLYFSSRDWAENGFGHESPRKLAKNVIERLSQSHVLHKTSSTDYDPDIPITIEDIYGESLNGCPGSNSDGVAQKVYPLDGSYEAIDGYNGKNFSGSHKQNNFLADNCGCWNHAETKDDMDVELHRASKEAEERVALLSEELEQESFLRDGGFGLPALIQTIRDLTEERMNLALEVSSLLQHRIAERAAAKEELKVAKAELDARTRRLEREKNELQSGLEKELDRRSSDWSFKLEKYQSEEQRLRDRVRELAEQNVSLQREVSSFNEREAESRRLITYSESQTKDLTARAKEAMEENQGLQQNLSELKEKYRAAEEDRDCFKRNYEEKEEEGKELHKSITRLLRTCSEQEKTIDGLRQGLSEAIGKNDKQIGKLQSEQMRLTGVEQALRREVESYRLEIDSLRHENISLLSRLKGNGKEGAYFTFKLDQELLTRICCLQNQGLSLLNESTQLCSKLLDFIKGKARQIVEAKQGIEVINKGLDGQFVVESGMKIQGFKRGIESLTRSLQTMSSLLHEKPNPAFKPRSQCAEDDRLNQLNEQTSEDIIKFELKAEALLTNLLREKLYSKELEVEQLRAELAAVVRGNDILRTEVQNTQDDLSCATHKLKDLELQMPKKDENINRLRTDFEESTKQLTIMKGILSKVSGERDLMWEEVKQCSEKNMLLNAEVNVLKKKIEALDEDLLLKEGQITILKDSLGNKPFDPFASLDSTREFLLE